MTESPEMFASLTVLEEMVQQTNTKLSTAPSPGGTMPKKKRKTVAELEADGAKRLRKAEEDHVTVVGALASARKELAEMRPLLQKLFARDPVLRAILQHPRDTPTPVPSASPSFELLP
eukprot:m.222967 g.222967  ORF g.222967 m.222967 type:complete len:118 (+) comp16142_c0_seq1:233-586(+)